MGRVATLIVNPAAGRAPLLASQFAKITAQLAGHDYTAHLLYTTSESHSARELVRQSLGSALILACGGDGTVHDVVQGIAHTGVPLGVLPLGTANALARNLGLPMDPLAALGRLLTYEPETIPLGELSTRDSTRLFTVVAGCGPDGALVASLPAGLKQTLGRTAYYAHAARLFGTRRWPAFQVEHKMPGAPTWHRVQAVAMMASRVRDLGGLFRGLTPRAGLRDAHLHVHLLRGPAHVALPAWFALGERSPWVTVVEASEVRCTPLTAEPIHAQADAEPAGRLPITLRIVPDALTLLMPSASPNAAPRRP